MPRVHFVKKARKSNKALGIKKGQSYYWWKFRRGGKRVSKTPPKRSQLTQSDFLSQWYDLEDRCADLARQCESAQVAEDLESIKSELESIAGDVASLKDDTESKKDSVEQAFPNGSPTIDLLQERVDKCEEVESALNDIEVPEVEEEEGEDEGEAITNASSEMQGEIEAIDWSVE